MRTSVLLAVLCLVVCPLAFASSLDAIAPSSIYVGSVEEYVQLRGSDLLGSVATTVQFSGPAGVFEIEPSLGSPSLLTVFVPDAVSSVAGTYAVRVFSDDGTAVRSTSPVSFSVIARPVDPPLLILPESLVAEATGPSGAKVDFQVAAISFADATATMTCDHHAGDLFPLGSTTVLCSATDSAGTANGGFLVRVADTTPPVITVPSDILSTSTTVTFEASATDLVDGSLDVTCSRPAGSTFAPGTTTVVCTATDASLNLGRGSFTVSVKTAATPTLTVPADFTAEATSLDGAVVTYSATADLGATVSCSPASGSTFAFGKTTVVCTASTADVSVSDSFVVTVTDTIGPVLTLPGNISVNATNSSGAVVNYVATAVDGVSGSVAVTCSPEAGTTFPLGLTTVNCFAYDGLTNISRGTFNVTVNNPVPPPVLHVPSDITTEATSASGAVVSYSVTVTPASATFVCTPPSGSTFAIATTTVNCTATNSAGSTSASFHVTVRDTTKPVLTLPGDLTAEATSPSGAILAFVATATDTVDGSVTVVCSPPSGVTFPIGSTLVQCSATDAHNNTATGGFFVNVQDTTAPAIVKITASVTYLWPPNHNLVPVTFTVQTSDAADPNPVTVIKSISSSQPQNSGGDGNTSPDYNISGPLSANLRSERNGTTDRIYTITFKTTDAAGNFTTATYQVIVGQPPSTRGRVTH
jgi:hypothetical protein